MIQRINIMSRVCQLTGTRANNGMAVSHSHIRTKKLQQANLQQRRLWWAEGNRWVNLRITTRALKTIQKKGLVPTPSPSASTSPRSEPSMPRITVNRREFLGISLAGALTWFWKPQGPEHWAASSQSLGLLHQISISGTIGGITTRIFRWIHCGEENGWCFISTREISHQDAPLRPTGFKMH